MVTKIIMPQLAQTTDELKFIKWLVSEGEDVKRGQSICEVETDKVTMEVESYAEGRVLKLIASPDTIIKSGEVIAVIGEPGESFDVGSDKAGEKIEARQEEMEIKKPETSEKAIKDEQEIESQSEIKATSLVKNLAKQKNIDLSKIKGTGSQGYITRDDVEKYEKSMNKEEVIELSRSQMAVARNLLRSKTEIPHYYLKKEISADLYLKIKESGQSISMYSVLIFAAAKALEQMPIMNGYFKDNKVFLRREINVGFALSVCDDLYVPVIRNADTKELSLIDKEIKALAKKANDFHLEASDISGGTFTITNLGMFDIDEFAAIINPSQSGIISIGRLKTVQFSEKDGTVKNKNILTLVGSFDHRYVNGKLGAEFINNFTEIFERDIVW